MVRFLHLFGAVKSRNVSKAQRFISGTPQFGT
jgi:hypothetical protein